ncbi:MAG: fructose-bisphosphate aldolase, partial [Sphingobacteriales bacterium]
MPSQKIIDLLGNQVEMLLNHQSKTIDKASLHLPSPHHIDKVWGQSNRSNQVLRSLNTMLNHGRLAGTGYLSILPV